MTTPSDQAPSARRRDRVVRGCLAGIAGAGVLFLMYVFTTLLATRFLDHTWERVQFEAKDRADVLRITARGFREERRDPPRGYEWYLPDRPGWTSYLYSIAFGSDDLGFYVIYDEREKILTVIDTYE